MPSSGVTIANPEFEWRTVAKEYGYKFEEFEALEVAERERIIAHHRLTQHIGAVLNKDADDKAKQAQRKN